MKKFRTPVILLAILLILGGIAYWDEWQTKKDAAADQTKNKPFAFVIDQVTAIDYFRQKDKEETADLHIALSKVGDKWQITAPMTSEADQEVVSKFLTNLRDFQYDKVVTDKRDKWQDFGLATPFTKVVITTGGSSKTVYIGNVAPVGYSAYVAEEGSPKVYLGSQYIRTAANKSLHDFRDKNLAKINNEQLVELTYESPRQPQLVFQPNNQGAWEIVKPTTTKLDVDDFWDFVSSLKSEKAMDFIDHPQGLMRKAFTPGNPGTTKVATVSWKDKGGTVKTLTFMKNNDDLYASYNPDELIYRLTEGFAKKIDKTVNDFRYRRILEVEMVHANKLTLDGKPFVKQGEAWTPAENGVTSSGADLGRLLVDLEFAKARDFKPLDEAFIKSLGKPLHTIQVEFGGASKQEPLTLEFWPNKGLGGTMYLKVSRANQLYVVSQDTLKNTAPQTAEDMDDDHDHT